MKETKKKGKTCKSKRHSTEDRARNESTTTVSTREELDAFLSFFFFFSKRLALTLHPANYVRKGYKIGSNIKYAYLCVCLELIPRIYAISTSNAPAAQRCVDSSRREKKKTENEQLCNSRRRSTFIYFACFNALLLTLLRRLRYNTHLCVSAERRSPFLYKRRLIAAQE